MDLEEQNLEEQEQNTTPDWLHEFKACLEKREEEIHANDQTGLLNELRQAENNWGMLFSGTSIQNSTFVINQGRPKESGHQEDATDIVTAMDDEHLLKWCSEHYGDFYFVFLIAACMLDGQPYSLINDIANELIEMFQREDEKGAVKLWESEYRSKVRDKLGILEYIDFTVVRGERLEEKFLRIQSHERALHYIRLLIQEFSQIKVILRQFLTKKLIVLCKKGGNYRLLGSCSEILALIGTDNLQYFNDQMIHDFIQETSCNTDYGLAVIMKKMYEFSECRGVIINCIQQWGKIRNNPHYTLTALYLCGMIGNQEMLVRDIWQGMLQEILEEMEGKKKRKEMQYFDMLPDFFDSGNRTLSYYKGVFHGFYKEMRNAEIQRERQRKAELETIFFMFVLNDFGNTCFSGSRKNGQDMLLIRVMRKLEKTTGEKLVYLWAELLKSHLHGREAWKILEQYFRKYEARSEEDMNILAFFLYHIGRSVGEEKVCKYSQEIARRKALWKKK